MDETKQSSKKKLARKVARSAVDTSARTLVLAAKVTLLVIVFLGLIVFWGIAQIPSEKEMKGCLTTKMYSVSLCPGSNAYVKLSQISTYMQKAVVLSEDGGFWQHNGFDLQELENSLKQNLEERRFARGGSTISQQLTKNMFLSRDKTLTRKALEAVITIRMEKVLSKKEILERYLNVVQFGKEIFGIKNAAKFYFKKSPSDLDLLESSFLVLLLPNPEIYSKSFFKKQLTPFAKKRMNQIVDRMYSYHHVTESEYLTAKSNLEYFLTGEEPPIITPEEELEFDQIDEESVEPEEI